MRPRATPGRGSSTSALKRGAPRASATCTPPFSRGVPSSTTLSTCRHEYTSSGRSLAWNPFLSSSQRLPLLWCWWWWMIRMMGPFTIRGERTHATNGFVYTYTYTYTYPCSTSPCGGREGVTLGSPESVSPPTSFHAGKPPSRMYTCVGCHP